MVTSISETTRLWEKALKKIEEKLNEKKTFDSWFADTYIYDINGSLITIAVKRPVAKVLLSGQYKQLILSTLADITDDNYEVAFVTYDEIANASKKSGITSKSSEKEVKAKYFENASIKFDLTFDNFVVGDCNKEAHKAAKYVAENDDILFNPLFIYSHSGLGKTHLLCAIGNKILERKPNAKILYIAANDLVEEYVKFLRAEKEGNSLKDFFKTVDVLLLDDVQFLAGKTRTEEMFFYIYQDMIGKNKKVIITSDRQPIELNNLEDRLVTRFKQGLTVSIKEPDLDTCAGIFKAKLLDYGIPEDRVDPLVINFVAEKFNKDIREIEGVAKRLKFFSLDGEKITVESAITVIGEIRGGNEVENTINIQKIINVVADYYKISPAQLASKVRTGQVALARHIAMYLIRRHLDVSLERIGDAFGGKDHTTVMSGINRVDKELKTNEQLRQAIDELEANLNK